MAGIHEPGAGFITGSGILGTGSAFDWPTEERFWQGQFPDLSYINADRTYDFYLPAFRYGSEAAASATGQGRNWDELEPELRTGWDRCPYRGSAGSWDEMRPAIHDSFHRYRARRAAAGRISDSITG